jgi:hypothetical protein
MGGNHPRRSNDSKTTQERHARRRISQRTRKFLLQNLRRHEETQQLQNALASLDYGVIGSFELNRMFLKTIIHHRKARASFDSETKL